MHLHAITLRKPRCGYLIRSLLFIALLWKLLEVCNTAVRWGEMVLNPACPASKSLCNWCWLIGLLNISMWEPSGAVASAGSTNYQFLIFTEELSKALKIPLDKSVLAVNRELFFRGVTSGGIFSNCYIKRGFSFYLSFSEAQSHGASIRTHVCVMWCHKP